MIELLTKSKPTIMDEFQINIPQYLREKLDPKQMEYIDDAFDMIEESV